MIRITTCSLITKSYVQDSIGQPIATETAVSVYCEVSNVSASEFLEAGQIGIKPDFRIKLWSHEYDGQDEVEVSGKRYSVYRRYEASDGRIELYVQKRAGNESQS